MIVIARIGGVDAGGAVIKELITNDDLDAALCTIDGTEHDYRPHTYESYRGGPTRTSLRCVWCHVVACGDHGEDDPCIEPYHHAGNHRTRSAVTWPKGGNRPDMVL